MDEKGELFEQNVALKLSRLHFELLYKRLEKDRFRWPQSETEVTATDGRQLSWLLEGLSLNQAKSHRQLSYATVA
jgi:transposase